VRVETSIFLLGLVSSVFLFGCEAASEPVQTPSGSTPATTGPDPDFAGCQAACGTSEAFDEAEIITQPGAEVGDLVRCPVSGAVFRVAEERPLVEHEGRHYYVCCAGCAGRFAVAPGRFAVPSA